MVDQEVKDILDKYGYNADELTLDEISYALDLIIESNNKIIEEKQQEIVSLEEDN